MQKLVFATNALEKAFQEKKIIIKRSYVRLDVTFAFGGIQLGDDVE